jgi:hypothetical protein
MVPRQDRPLQTWKTFLRIHVEGMASRDAGDPVEAAIAYDAVA